MTAAVAYIDTYRMTIEWGDCDPAQIVFYPNYFRWFDAASRALYGALFGSKEALLARHELIGIPAVSARADFLRPSRVGDEVTFASRIAGFGSKQFTIEHVCSRGGRKMLVGEEVRVLGRAHPNDPERLVAVELPAEVVEVFERHGAVRG